MILGTDVLFQRNPKLQVPIQIACEIKINWYEPQASPGPEFRPKGRGIYPEDLNPCTPSP
jgi:hypothetical protein